MRQLTHGPRHHFLGRAGVSPWNASGTRLACLETLFHGRAPHPGERATLGIVDPNTGGFTAVATTAAWDFQRGAWIEWCHQSPNDELLFNDVIDGSPVGVRLNVLTGARQTYLRPLVAAGGEGACAASVSLGRIARLSLGEGAAGATDPNSDETAPESDGLFTIGLATGLQRLIVSLASVAAEARARHTGLQRREFWFDHVSFNPAGNRMLFTVFAGGHGARTEGALWAVGIDGSGLRELVPFGRGATRGAWIDSSTCVSVFRSEGGVAPYVLSDSAEPAATACAGSITGPVRAVPSPDRSRLAVESENPRRREKTLSAMNHTTGAKKSLVDIRTGDDTLFHGAGRCDFSPRWNSDGSVLCVDVVGIEGTRQLHLVNVPGGKHSMTL